MNKKYREPWYWSGSCPLTEREFNLLIGLVSGSIEESERGNYFRATPYSEDLSVILEKLQDGKDFNI